MTRIALAIAALLLIPAADAFAGCGGLSRSAAAAFTGRARLVPRLRVVRAPVVNVRVAAPPVLVVPQAIPKQMPLAVPPVIVKPSPPAIAATPEPKVRWYFRDATAWVPVDGSQIPEPIRKEAIAKATGDERRYFSHEVIRPEGRYMVSVMPSFTPAVNKSISPPSLTPVVGSATTVTRTVTKSVTPVVVTQTWRDPATGCTMQMLSDGTLRRVGCPARR